MYQFLGNPITFFTIGLNDICRRNITELFLLYPFISCWITEYRVRKQVKQLVVKVSWTL